MKALINLSITHARTVLMILILLLVTGSLTYLTIPKEADPDIDIPVLHTQVILDGISPEDSDRTLVRPLESALERVEGVRKVQSVAFEGGATVTLEFDAGFDAATAMADVREAVDRARPDLPEGVEEPEVVEINTSQFPQLVVGLGGPVPERALYRVADQLKEALEMLPGVLEVEVNGKREEMVEIIVDPNVLESYNISQLDILNAVERNNELVAAGVLDSGAGRFALKVSGVIESAEELLQLPLKSIGGKVVRMRDIAQVRRVYKDSTAFVRVGGQPSITMEIKKRSGANVVGTIDQVKQLVSNQRQQWPGSLQVSYFGDRSIDIRDTLKDLENSVIIAVLLVVIVVIAAMGLRSAALVAVAIPGSFVIGTLVLDLMGLTVNIVVLFSLVIAVGVLVDGAIVVTEYADRRMIAQVPRMQAYRQAAERMSWPIITSTGTTLAAFLPLLFWPGVVGEFMKYLPITLISTLTASLVMALFFVPTMGGMIGKSRSLSPRKMAAIRDAERGDLTAITGLTGMYVRLLSWAVRFPGSVLLLVLAVMFAISAAYSRMGHGTEFFPDVEPQQAVVTLLARGDLSVRERDDILRRVENEVLKISEIKTAYARTSVDDDDRIASITLEFSDWNKRERRVDEVLAQIRRLEHSFAGLRLEIQKMNAGPGGDRKPIQLVFKSANEVDSARTVRLVSQWMQEHGGFTDIEDGLPLPGLEWNINVDREKAGRFGADISLVGAYVQLVTNGVKLSTYRPDDSNEELDIRVRFPPEQRQLSQLQDLRVATANGYVPLSNFATLEPRSKVTVIKRMDGVPIYRLKASPKALPGEDVVNAGQLTNARITELREATDAMDVIPGVKILFEGQDEDQQESQIFLVMALGVAVFVIAIILVTQFNSFYQASLVLTAVLLSLGGVFLGLLVAGQAFGIIMSGVGVISLAGIVVNNNIVLIDTFNTLCKQGMPVVEAAIRTGAQRLRPVMLTTVTTVLALLPMAMKVNVDLFGREITFGSPSTQWWSQLATAIAGGLTFATVLTLILTPCLLVYPTVFRARRRVKRLKKRLDFVQKSSLKPVS